MNQLLSGKLDGAIVSMAELSTLTSSVEAYDLINWSLQHKIYVSSIGPLILNQNLLTACHIGPHSIY